MRGVLVLAVVAACYRPAPDRCEVTVGNAACSDAPGDPPGDQLVQQPTCTVGSALGERNVFPGNWFAARLDGDPYAILSALTPDANQVNRPSILGTADDILINPTFPTIFQGDMFIEYQSPRLTYDGLELFARADKGSVHEIVHSTRTPGTGTWSPLEVLTFKDLDGMPVAIQPGVDPSPPTLITPRRMILVYGTNGFEEYEENAAHEWELKRSHLYAFDPPFAGQAQLTSDGLQLVYVSSGKINVSVRPTIDSDFATTATQVATQLPAFRPFLLADCQHLFYDEGSVARMVSY